MLRELSDLGPGAMAASLVGVVCSSCSAAPSSGIISFPALVSGEGGGVTSTTVISSSAGVSV